MTNLEFLSSSAESDEYTPSSITASISVAVGDDVQEWNVQTTDGEYSNEMGCLIFVDGEEHEWKEDIADIREAIIAEAESVACAHLVHVKTQEIKEAADYAEIEALAHKISGIMTHDSDQNLITLAAALHRAENLDINNTMIYLQISYQCSAEQSAEILRAV